LLIGLVLGLGLPSSTVFVAGMFVAVALSAAMGGLLSWAGAPFYDFGWRTMNPELRRHLWRDMWWLPRR
jgi:hypothetical protein